MKGYSFVRQFVRVRAALPLLLMLSLTSCAHRVLTPEQTLVEKIIEAYGGRAALARVQAFSAEGTITRLMSKDEGTYTRFMRRDGNILVSIAYPNSLEVRLLERAKGLPGRAGATEGSVRRSVSRHGLPVQPAGHPLRISRQRAQTHGDSSIGTSRR